MESMPISNPKFIKKAHDYRLLYACRFGLKKRVSELLEKGADISAIDYADNTVIYSLQNNGKICTLDELFDSPLNNAKLVMVNKFFAGEATYGSTPIDYAIKTNDIDIVEKLLEFGDYDDLIDKKALKQLIENDRSEILKFKEEIIQTQSNSDIPNFEIEGTPDFNKTNEENLQERFVSSMHDESIHLKVLLGKKFVKILPEPDNKYKGKYLDLDSLATLYAFLILWNGKDGTRICNVFKSWKDYKFFRKLVMMYVSQGLRYGAYKFDPNMAQENLIILANNIISLPEAEFVSYEESFFTHIFKYLFVISHDQKEWIKNYNKLLELLLTHPVGKNFLIKLCNNEKILYCPTLKIEMQKHMLRKYVARMLMKANPPYPKDLAENIAEFWEPSEEFMGYIRKPTKQS